MSVPDRLSLLFSQPLNISGSSFIRQKILVKICGLGSKPETCLREKFVATWRSGGKDKHHLLRLSAQTPIRKIFECKPSKQLALNRLHRNPRLHRVRSARSKRDRI